MWRIYFVLNNFIRDCFYNLHGAALLVVLLSVLSTSSLASKGCIHGDSKEVHIARSKENGSVVKIDYCWRGGTGDVVIDLINDRIQQKYKFIVDNEAYSIGVNSSIDLTGQGGRDLGIANGKGRSGEGMWYWIFDGNSRSYKFVGEAPLLRRSKAKNGPLFAIVSGSGDVQATRYSYRIKGGKLAVVGAISFTPVDDAYDISLMICASDIRCGEVGRLKNISSERAQKCMEGVDDCNYLK